MSGNFPLGTMAAVAAHGLVGSGTRLPLTPLEQDEWNALLDGVRNHRITGFLLWAIRDGALATTPRQRREALEAHARARRFVLLLEGLLLEVVERLEADDIQYRVLKGPAAARLSYRQPWVRTYGDIDLLIPESQIEAAIALLADLGFRRDRPQRRPEFDRRFGKGVTVRTTDGYPIDLHRTLAAGPFAQRIHQRELFTTSSSFLLRQHRLPALGAEERFLHACLHAALEDSGLVPLRDLAQMAQTSNLSLNRVHDLCNSWKAGAPVAHAVRVAWSLFRLTDQLPISAWAHRFQPDPSDARTLRLYSLSPGSEPILAFAELRAVPGIKAKASYLRAMVFPDRGYLDARREGYFDRWRRASRSVLNWRSVR